MFFLFGISSLILVFKLYDTLHELLKKIDSNNVVADVGLKGFLLYTKMQSRFSQIYDMCYENDIFFRDYMNYLHIGYNRIITAMYNYKKEPVDANWIHISMLFRCNNDSSRKIVPKLIENYDIIHNRKDRNLTDMIVHRKMLFFNHANDLPIPSTNFMTMYLMKYYDKYLCKHNCYGMFQQWCSKMKTVNNPFFEIEYTDEENGVSYTIDIPKSYFVENNELLSFVFLKRWFDYSYTEDDFVFNEDYIINITDDSFDTLTLTRNEYILLTDKGYSIEKIK